MEMYLGSTDPKTLGQKFKQIVKNSRRGEGGESMLDQLFSYLRINELRIVKKFQ